MPSRAERRDNHYGNYGFMNREAANDAKRGRAHVIISRGIEIEATAAYAMRACLCVSVCARKDWT